MYKVTQQQASELKQKCGNIKKIADPTLFLQIELLIQQADSSRLLTDKEVNLLYKLLNRVSECAMSSNKENLHSEWNDTPHKDKKKESENKKEKDIRNHILLSSRVNLRTIAAMRRCIQMIVTPVKSQALARKNDQR